MSVSEGPEHQRAARVRRGVYQAVTRPGARGRYAGDGSGPRACPSAAAERPGDVPGERPSPPDGVGIENLDAVRVESQLKATGSDKVLGAGTSVFVADPDGTMVQLSAVGETYPVPK